jgi:hypothetical protein
MVGTMLHHRHAHYSLTPTWCIALLYIFFFKTNVRNYIFISQLSQNADMIIFTNLWINLGLKKYVRIKIIIGT